jgi:hypothetical protein
MHPPLAVTIVQLDAAFLRLGFFASPWRTCISDDVFT